MDEIVWLLASLWLGLLALSNFTERLELSVFSSLMGLILGVFLVGESLLIAFAVILMNVILFLLEMSK